MNIKQSFYLLIAVLIFSSCGSESHQDSSDTDTTSMEASASALNSLTEAEKSEGWKLLFNGKNTDGWRCYKKESADGWQVVDGILTTEGGNTDIMTTDQYENFELSLEWSISPGGNSGILFNIIEAEEYDRTHNTAPEYQIIDDNGYHDELEDDQKSGANYAMHPPSSFMAKEPGEFNHARIIVNQGRVEHWLNGEKVVEYELWTDAWKQRVSETKFAAMPGYGTAKGGYIGLQDHQDKVSFRNIKIRTL